MRLNKNYGRREFKCGTKKCKSFRKFTFLILKLWFLNSVGSECYSYKVEVVGSSPTETTLTNPCGKWGQLMIICKIVVMGI